MYSSTTKHTYRAQAISRGKRQARLNKYGDIVAASLFAIFIVAYIIY